MNTTLPLESAASATDPARMRVGSLRYTSAGLVWVFLWLVWGDFAFHLMEAVVPSIMPLRFKELQARDWLIMVVLNTTPATLNFMLNPVISTASDRHRGSIGRRIPFLLYSTPVITASLILLAFAPELGAWMHRLLGPLTGWSLGAFLIGVLAVLYVIFQVSNLFITTVFYYFFNDVVPIAYMGRFMGLFRMGASAAAFVYNWYIYQHALTYSREIFLGAAAVYFVGFMSMCWGVKEGRYGAIPPMAAGLWGKFKTYAKECLTHRLYWYYFLHSMFWSVAQACMIYNVLLNLSLGVTLAQMGKITAVVSIVQFLLMYPVGILADKFHPLRVMLGIKLALALVLAPLNFVWLFGNFSPHTAYLILIGLAAVELPLGLIFMLVQLPVGMRLMPKSRFGQFCSFNAIAGAGMSILGSLIAAGFIEWMGRLFPPDIWGKDYHYRMIPAWKVPFLLVALVFLVLVYREWKRLGGDKSYVAPGFAHEETRT